MIFNTVIFVAVISVTVISTNVILVPNIDLDGYLYSLSQPACDLLV